jgi:hypothetical protein
MQKLLFFLSAALLWLGNAQAQEQILKFPNYTVGIPSSYKIAPMLSANSFFAENEKSTVTITRREFPLKKPSEKMAKLVWSQNLELMGSSVQAKDCRQKKNVYECSKETNGELVRMWIGQGQILLVHQKTKTGQLTSKDLVSVKGVL